MPFHTTVLYPNDPDTKFDMSYYLKTHMPLVMQHFGKHGLKGYEVTEYGPGGDGAKPPYCTGCTLKWDSPDQVGAAVGSPDSKPVFDDIPNFSNKEPIFMGGAVVDAK
ncbi:uncharacterized protein Z518_10335 [Rhinocladiella mackenziei CBS 650.93]|uniref:Rhinocladiella mackenziei CBS 650.93 unplaced genomic scaffold supercont1.9, whole genome shotgun sequence n=1 Tax=Rhinocladiella mackenziei CBS 650.93 TaxID=1442369 RepID=A0A0D2FDN7_9EURO|nr:uncharacterized protein Z518_10335 [Rhinocladiella mackenziei CBS 650.93]KIX00197.1 hypothetical protein Z518_10335 [Rhinocladiella mackenziei CBS 650.93]